MNDNPLQFAPAPGRQATAREFLAVVFRRKWLIIGLFAVATVTVVVIALSTPKSYVSSGRILIKRGEQQSVLVPDRRVMNDWESDLATEMAIARSGPVLELARKILEKESAGAVPRIDVRRVDAEVVGKSNLVALAYEDRDPIIAQQVCRAMLSAYIDYHQNVMTLSYPEGFFEGEILGVRKELEDWVERRRRFTNENHIADTEEQTRSLVNLIGDLQKKRDALDADLAQMRSTVAAMETMRDRQDIELPGLGGQGSSDALVDFKRKVLDQETRVATLREHYRDDSPEVVNATATLDTLRNLLHREVGTRMDMSNARIHALESSGRVIDRNLATYQTQLAVVPDQQVRLAEMDREIGVLRTRLENLSRVSDQARVTQHTTPTLSIVLMSPAGRATSKTTHDYVRLALAPMFSLVVGIGLAFFLDGLDLTVRTASQAEEALELPVLATLNERRRAR